MEVTLWKIDQVKPYENNPRDNDDAVSPVAKSIQQFGWRQPLVVDGEGVIIVGHTRWRAAKKLKLSEVPVHVATDLSADQIRAYRLADNQTGTLSCWDNEKLVVELFALKDVGFDLDMIGFSTDELDKVLHSQSADGLCDADEIPAPPDEATTKPGDLWILGDHRLLCGDSSKEADLDRLLGGEAIHLVNTDPPYNVKVEPRSNNAIAAGLSSFQATHHQSMDVARHPGKAKPTQKKLRAKDRPLANDFVGEVEFEQMLNAWFGNASRVLQPGRSFYIWGGYANCANYPPALKATGLYFSQAIIWDKQHPVLTRKDFMGAHEWCQPPDTQVLTPSGSASLGSLTDDDRVVSFSRAHAAMVGLRQGQGIRTTSRPYNGALYGVVVGERTTWSTGGHLWSVKLRPEYRSLWCVYLMRRGKWWRVGVTKMLTSWGFGLKGRMSSEHGEEGWILSLHGSHAEARVIEQMVSVKYGIPMTCWKESPHEGRREASHVALLYDHLDLDQLEQAACLALGAYNREREYPFVQMRCTRPKYGNRHPMIVRSCNLLPGIMEVPVPVGGQKIRWEPIRAVDVQPYEGPVYSMAVDRYQHYVADGLVTHNCFYGWKLGAAHEFFGPNNVPDLWAIKKVNPTKMVHLTEKPAELAARAMQYSSRPGENVLDLFGGSGSTLIAAEQTGRKAFLMELDPLYCDVIVERFEKFTGKKAELANA